MVSFGLSPDEHFSSALKTAAGNLPNETPCTVDPDLSFVAEMMVSARSTISGSRRKVVKAVAKLQYRWQSVTGFFRKQQSTTTRQVTRERDIGLIPLLALLIAWPDVQFSYNLISGFPAVGHCSWSGVFPGREVSSSEKHDIFEGALANNKKLLAKMRPGKDDDTILNRGMEDAEKGFASEPIKMEELEKSVGGSNFRLIRRFVITQATGKKRIIDDAADGGQSEVSTDGNALCFCSAIQPAHHIEAIQNYLGRKSIPWPAGRHGCIKSVGED